MEILIFENAPFREIPEQDNPYYDKEDTTECLIISRVPEYVPTFEVSHISKEKNLYVCEWIDENTLVFAGKDKILKAFLID